MQNKDIKHYQYFQLFCKHFYNYSNLNIALALCFNDKNGSFHYTNRKKQEHKYHFHGIINTDTFINFSTLFSSKLLSNPAFFIEKLDNLHLDNFINYINDKHVVTSEFLFEL